MDAKTDNAPVGWAEILNEAEAEIDAGLFLSSEEVRRQFREAKARPSNTAAMDRQTERAARMFLQRLKGKYAVIEAILFGSRARGTHTSESDADIAVLLEGTAGNRYAAGGDFAEIAFDVMMETGVLVEALPFWADELKNPQTFSNPELIENILRDGLRL